MTFSFEFDAAIASHKVWLQRLEFVLDGIEQSGIQIEQAGNASVCSLGTWLNGPGQAFRGLRSFEHLQQTHQEFHHQAAEVVRLWRAGDHATAEQLLIGPVTELSTEVELLLESMKREHHAQR